MAAKLVRGRSVICGVGDDGAVMAISDGAVLVEDGMIAAVGRAADLAHAAAAAGAEVVGGDDFVVFPGLVNAHHHVGLTPFQLGAPDLPLELWLVDRMGARAVPWRLDTLYSAFELVRSGVTTVQHLHNRVPGGPDGRVERPDAMIGAYTDWGCGSAIPSPCATRTGCLRRRTKRSSPCCRPRRGRSGRLGRGAVADMDGQIGVFSGHPARTLGRHVSSRSRSPRPTCNGCRRPRWSGSRDLSRRTARRCTCTCSKRPTSGIRAPPHRRRRRWRISTGWGF